MLNIKLILQLKTKAANNSISMIPGPMVKLSQKMYCKVHVGQEQP